MILHGPLLVTLSFSNLRAVGDEKFLFTSLDGEPFATNRIPPRTRGGRLGEKKIFKFGTDITTKTRQIGNVFADFVYNTHTHIYTYRRDDRNVG